MGWLNSILSPTENGVNSLTGSSKLGTYVDPWASAFGYAGDNLKGLSRWADKEGHMPLSELEWWKNGLNGKNGNSLGSWMGSHNALHAGSTTELNHNNWFATHPDETAAMVFSLGSASGAFGAGAASGEGAGIGATEAGSEEAALAGGSSVGYGAGAGTVDGAAAAGGAAAENGSGGLNSLSTSDSAAGDSALSSGESTANLGSDYGSGTGLGNTATTNTGSGNFGQTLKDYWRTGNRIYKGYNAVQDAKNNNWVGAAQNAWGAYGNGAGLGSSGQTDSSSAYGDDYGSNGTDYSNPTTGGSNVDDNWWNSLINDGGDSSGSTTPNYFDTDIGSSPNSYSDTFNTSGANGYAGGNSYFDGASDGTNPTTEMSYPQQLKSLFQQGNQYLQPIGGIKGALKGASTLYSMYNQRKQAGLAKHYMDQMEGMYQPGTPEYEQFAKQLAATDAMHGRRSQVGSRSVELAARMAENRSRMLSSPAYQSALGAYGARNSSTLNGLFSLAGQYNPS